MKTQQTGKPILDALINASESLSTTRPPEQHSPLPWIFDGRSILIGQTRHMLRADGIGFSKADAAYIVKACNEYPKIIAERDAAVELAWENGELRDELLAAGNRLENAVSDLLNEPRSLEIQHYAETALHEWSAIAKCEASNPTT